MENIPSATLCSTDSNGINAPFAPSPCDRFEFPEEEKKILEFWRSINAFKTSIELSKGRPFYSFFDGPPFATGLPHYGHILAGTVKDVVTRYASLNGYYVERRFGWDCHGLPVEYEIDKKLGISGRQGVAQMGIAAYNAECKSIVMRFSKEWEAIVERCGRWIDFENDYKTMYLSYMETVWWVFKSLWDKGQVYRKFKVMPYSTACNTSLSNFELAQNYKDIVDPSVIVEFPLEEEKEENDNQNENERKPTIFLVWTTTPWTLPSNLMICVHPDMEYSHVEKDEKIYIVMSSRLEFVFGTNLIESCNSNSNPSSSSTSSSDKMKIIKKSLGKELFGKRYRPLFNFFTSRLTEYPSSFTIACDSYVTSDCGTGLVHQAPAFGQEDFEICLKAGVIKGEDLPCPIDDAGCFTSPILNVSFSGLHWKDANPIIMKEIESMKRMFKRGQEKHSYPHCWRSDTPLIYKAVPSWFVRVSSIIENILEGLEKTNWVPENVKEKRFHNWISSAPDWAISRNRFWGTPIPIWISKDGEEQICVGSIKELEELSGVTGISDIHRENIDHITIPSRRGANMPPLHRIDEVFDCWFESGCVPYAQQHYPFENIKEFEASFPADFIGEGIDQTRGWFYVLMVIGTHLFGKAPFKNVIVNGHVLAGDGCKMSKRLKNYPEPTKIVNEYGADALRLFLIDSPVVRAENLRFQEEGVKEIVKNVLLPWYNAFKFLQGQLEMISIDSNNGNNYQFKHDPNCSPFEILMSDSNASGNSNVNENTIDSNGNSNVNITDAWIMAAFNNLLKNVQEEMASYKLYAVVSPLLKFIQILCNWYIRFNRKRSKGEFGKKDQEKCIQVLFYLMYSFTIMMAPFTPFLSESLYQKMRPYLEREPDGLKDVRSVHFLLYPSPDNALINPEIERAFGRLQELVERVRVIRENKNIPLKMPLRKVIIVSSSRDESISKDLSSLKSYILDELNVHEMECSTDEKKWGISYRAVPNFKLLGQRLRKDFGMVQEKLKSLSQSQLEEFFENGKITIMGYCLTSEDLEVIRECNLDDSKKEERKDQNENGNEVDNHDEKNWKEDYKSASTREFVVILDCCTSDPRLRDEGLVRELINRIQRLRKKAGLRPSDEVKVSLDIINDSNEELKRSFESKMDMIIKGIKSKLIINEEIKEIKMQENGNSNNNNNGNFNSLIIEEEMAEFGESGAKISLKLQR